MRPTKPIIIRGVTYPSRQAAADALGISVWTVYRALRFNRIDTLGLGRSAPPRPCKPITINGVRYPSRAAAAKALGVSKSKLWQIMQELKLAD